MLLEFETINHASAAMIHTYLETRVIDHSLVQDFGELEDGTLQIILYDGNDSFLTKTYKKKELIEKLKECETLE